MQKIFASWLSFRGKEARSCYFLFKLNTGYSNQMSSILSTVDIWMGNLTKKYCLSLIVIKQRLLLVKFAIENVIQNPLSYLHKLGPVTTFHDSFDHLVGWEVGNWGVKIINFVVVKVPL